MSILQIFQGQVKLRKILRCQHLNYMLKTIRVANQQCKDQKYMIKRSTRELKNVEEVFQHQDLLYILEIFLTKLISHRNNDPLTGHFGINKTC